jgi:hypothetical protein
MAMAKSWREKLDNGRKPEIGPTVRSMAGVPVGAIMLVPTPIQIKEYIEAIPRGEFKTVDQLKSELAKQNGAEVVCPLVTGISLRIISEAALEEHHEGKDLSTVTPFWRVLDAKSKAAAKLSCGPEFLTQMRQSES